MRGEKQAEGHEDTDEDRADGGEEGDLGAALATVFPPAVGAAPWGLILGDLTWGVIGRRSGEWGAGTGWKWGAS
jgi:hypothetical protein